MTKEQFLLQLQGMKFWWDHDNANAEYIAGIARFDGALAAKLQVYVDAAADIRKYIKSKMEK